MAVKQKKAVAPKAKWRVSVDVVADFITAEQAVEFARKMRIEHGEHTSTHIFYAE